MLCQPIKDKRQSLHCLLVGKKAAIAPADWLSSYDGNEGSYIDTGLYFLYSLKGEA